MAKKRIKVDVIIPVHNAEATVEETVMSAMQQIIAENVMKEHDLSINVCCYDDGSTDKSWEMLKNLQQRYKNENTKENEADQLKETDPPGDGAACRIVSRLLIEKSQDGIGRGAGFARNRAAELSHKNRNHDDDKRTDIVEQFLCLLDSDDIMHPARVIEQTCAMMRLPPEERRRTLLGCKVERDPPDSTWHYTKWANSLSDDRLMLERYRECTLLQPTWFLTRSRFELLGGYIEASKVDDAVEANTNNSLPGILRLIHPTFDTPETLRLAEDLRFFHSHLQTNDGLLRLHRPSKDPDMPLVIYRHRANQSQSFQTSRKLLLHLRALAFEKCVLQQDNLCSWSTSHHGGSFVVWGAGRDGKDFVKALSIDARKRVYCFVDVDEKKIEQGFYANQEVHLKVPIVHFSLLAKSKEEQQRLLDSEAKFGQIDKSKPSSGKNQQESAPKHKKQKTGSVLVAASPKVAKTIDLSILPELPVVVCVAMYRTNGALEENVKSIGRTEGKDLWHFS